MDDLTLQGGRSRPLAAAIVVAAALLFKPSIANAVGWQLVESMPTSRAYHASATLGNHWYVAGGETLDGNNEQFPTEIDVYDPASGHWTVLGQLAQGREDLLAVADPLRDRVLFCGGMIPGPEGFLSLAVCDSASAGGVGSAPSMSWARYRGAAALVGSKLVVSGGWGRMDQTWSNVIDAAEMWDGASAGWAPAGSIPAGPRSGHSMTTLTNEREVLVAAPLCRGSAIADYLLDASSGIVDFSEIALRLLESARPNPSGESCETSR